ncbi:MAG TPA: VOC family protein [Acetobacteraceae bacterium]|nr:VOC family protein [Acetobacteraceae bacterium]
MLPVPTLDHVVVNARDRLDEAHEVYRRLGFTLTPRGYHTLGSMNHLAVFGTDYLELIAAPAGDSRRPEILGAPVGLNGLVFGTEDSAAVHEALSIAGVPVEPPDTFSRPVELPGGATRDAVFRTVRLKSGTTEAGRLYFCQHFQRDLVWRDEWRHHPNGAIGVARAVIAATNPTELAGLFARMFGVDAVQRDGEIYALPAGLASFAVTTPTALAATFGDAAPDAAGRGTFMAALSLRVRSLAQAATALAAGGVAIHRGDRRIIVPASAAFGVALEFLA